MTAYVNTANKGTLNLRATPESNGKILAQIPYHTTLEVEYVNNDWSKTTYKDQTGYIKTEFLSSGKAITRSDLQQIYNSLKQTLATIENILK